MIGGTNRSKENYHGNARRRFCSTRLRRPSRAPPSACLNEQGYYVGRVERNLYWVTDGVYQCAFLTTSDGVVLWRRATDNRPQHSAGDRRDRRGQRREQQGDAPHLLATTTPITVVPLHCSATVSCASPRRDAAALVARQRSSPPAPEETFQDRRTLEIGGERIELAWHGPNHSPDNSYIYFPDHDTLMLVDIVNAGWVPVYNLNLTEDRVGYVAAPGHALNYQWSHLISGHVGGSGRVTTSSSTSNTSKTSPNKRARRWQLSTRRRTSRSTARMHGLQSRAISTRSPTPLPSPSSRSTQEYWRRPTCSPPTRRSGCSKSIRLDLGVGSQVHP